MGMIKCSVCGADVDDQYKFCSECGSPIVKAEAAVEAVEEKAEEAAAAVEEKAEEAVTETAEAVDAAPAPVAAPVEAAPAPVQEAAPVIAPAAIFAQPAPAQQPMPAYQPVMQPVPMEQGKPKKQKKAKKVKNEVIDGVPVPKKKGGAGKVIALFLVILAALALIGGGLYFFLFANKDSVSLPEYTEKSFCKILTKNLDLDEDRDFVVESEKKTTTITATSDDPFFQMAIYKNEDKAQKEFDKYISDFEEELDGDFTSRGSAGEEYFTFNGELDGEDRYGGVYLNGNTIIIVYTTSTRGSATESVDEFLDTLELPTP